MCVLFRCLDRSGGHLCFQPRKAVPIIASCFSLLWTKECQYQTVQMWKQTMIFNFSHTSNFWKSTRDKEQHCQKILEKHKYNCNYPPLILKSIGGYCFSTVDLSFHLRIFAYFCVTSTKQWRPNRDHLSIVRLSVCHKSCPDNFSVTIGGISSKLYRNDQQSICAYCQHFPVQ